MRDRKPWQEFASLTSGTPTKFTQPQKVKPEDLVDMASMKTPYFDVFVAYAQNHHIFDEKGRPKPIAQNEYDKIPKDQRLIKVNKFGKAYKDSAKLWLHREMASVVSGAAKFMHEQDGWGTILYDGLRTVDGAYNMYLGAEQSDLDDKLLSAPGLSAHNKAMAADLVMFDRERKLVDMGGNFDHLDMKTNSRNDTSLGAEVVQNRIRREIAFQHAALAEGKLFAPLRAEFWDERFPENEADHWRVLESLSRCAGRKLLSDEDMANARAKSGSLQREAFHKKWELMNYNRFKEKFSELFADGKELRAILKLPETVKLPPDRETVVYHGDFHPLYDRDLPVDMQLTTNEQERETG